MLLKTELESTFQLEKVEYFGKSTNISRTSNIPLKIHSEKFPPQVSSASSTCHDDREIPSVSSTPT